MACVMTGVLPAGILSCLPPALAVCVERVGKGYTDFYDRLSEIRMRTDRVSSLVLDGKNLPLPIAVSEEEMAETVNRLSEGSIYAHRDTLTQGYIALGNGCRAGVAGEAVLENGKITALRRVTSLTIRLYHRVKDAGATAEKIFRENGKQGMLVYSPPGGGKTTLLTDLALRLAVGKEAMRVALIDERSEFYIDKNEGRGALLDVLRGYPKACGIRLAVRTLSPEVIICDELGDTEEAAAVAESAKAGVPIIASVHAGDYAGFLKRPVVRLLAEADLFTVAVGLSGEKGRMVYTVNRRDGGAI